MAERKPEFISLMRTIRDVYYKEMGSTVQWMKNYSNIFYAYVQQIKKATVSNVTTVVPVSDTEFGQATVIVDTTTDPSKMQFSFGVPAGLKGQKGDQGAGVSIKGSDTYANIILKTDALLGECWISTDTPAILPPSGTAAIGDGLVPLNDNPADETEWLNVGPMRGPSGSDGQPGQDGTDGVNGRDGEKWFVVPSAPSLPDDIPGAELGDLALVANVNPAINGEFYELYGDGWHHMGNLKGNTGDTGAPGALWYTGAGIPSDALGINGDLYVDTATNNYYQKASNTWGSPIGNLGATVDWSNITSIPVGMTTVSVSGDTATFTTIS